MAVIQRFVLALSCLAFVSIFYVMLSSDSAARAEIVPVFPPKGLENSTECGSSRGIHTAKTIFVITPTYPRREQAAELTRLGQTLLLAEDLHWVLAEDSERCSPLVGSLLARLNLPYTHLASPQSKMYKQSSNLKKNPRGVSSRRAGLHWVMENFGEGVVYFADDDNTYDLRLFSQMRETRRVSMFPVGLIGQQGVSSPIVKDGQVVGFSDSWFGRRKFPVDMAGFAINLAFLRERNPEADKSMPYQVGFEEDTFLRSLKLNLTEIEPLANNCTEVLVWHTQSLKENKANLYVDHTAKNSSLEKLLKNIHFSGIASSSAMGKPMKSCYNGKKCRTS